MSGGRRRRGWFEYSNGFIVVWSMVMFMVFGLLSNLYDQESVPYNLGQGVLVALSVGLILYAVKRSAHGRKKAG